MDRQKTICTRCWTIVDTHLRLHFCAHGDGGSFVAVLLSHCIACFAWKISRNISPRCMQKIIDAYAHSLKTSGFMFTKRRLTRLLICRLRLGRSSHLSELDCHAIAKRSTDELDGGRPRAKVRLDQYNKHRPHARVRVS